MLQLLPSSISQQIPHGRNLVVSSQADGLREETGEFFKSLMARNESPTSSLARNPWFSETIEVSEELLILVIMIHDHQKVSQRMEAAEMLIICVMDLVEWMILTIFVELKSNRNWHIKKSPLFWVVLLGLQIHVIFFDNSLRWMPKNRLKRQTFQLSLRIFFPFKRW